MTEIVLPIKCNTVKTASSFFKFILLIEFTVLAILGSISFVWFCYIAVFYSNLVPLKPELLLYYLGAIIPFMWCIYFDIMNYLPTITCIKDEVDRP